MTMIIVTKMGDLKGLLSFPLPKKPIDVSNVSTAMKTVNLSKGSKLKPLATDTTSWTVETDKGLRELEVENENIEAYYTSTKNKKLGDVSKALGFGK